MFEQDDHDNDVNNADGDVRRRKNGGKDNPENKEQSKDEKKSYGLKERKRPQFKSPALGKASGIVAYFVLIVNYFRVSLIV